MALPFQDRQDAGRQLGERLAHYAGDPNVIVLGLPRGGVPVAAEVAHALGDAPMDVFVVRKLGVPGHRELAMGAIASGGVRVLNENVVRALDISPMVIDAVAAQEQRELERRAQAFGSRAAARDYTGRKVIVVDDGLATGSTMRAAVKALRQLNPESIIVAVPVGARETCGQLRPEADAVICLHTPEPFHAVGVWYRDFGQTTDEEVRHFLGMAAPAR